MNAAKALLSPIKIAAKAKKVPPKAAKKTRPTELKQQLFKQIQLAISDIERVSVNKQTTDPKYALARFQLKEAHKELAELKDELRDQLNTVQAYLADSSLNGPRKYGKYKKGDPIFCSACGQGLQPAQLAAHTKTACPVRLWRVFRAREEEEKKEIDEPTTAQSSPELEISFPISTSEPVGQPPAASGTPAEPEPEPEPVEPELTTLKPTKPPKKKKPPPPKRPVTCSFCSMPFGSTDEMYTAFFQQNCSRTRLCERGQVFKDALDEKKRIIKEEKDKRKLKEQEEEEEAARLLLEEEQGEVDKVEVDKVEVDKVEVEVVAADQNKRKVEMTISRSSGMAFDSSTSSGNLNDANDIIGSLGDEFEVIEEVEEYEKHEKEGEEGPVKGDEMRKWMEQFEKEK
ncbi:hypothetical protein QBC43DRAFT_318825 [Cladorrhinum sp. PSN259]|nr:hypothetical protein QBC43DRAFT_318825 [Cladorrhinum sp. PSN259]